MIVMIPLCELTVYDAAGGDDVGRSRPNKLDLQERESVYHTGTRGGPEGGLGSCRHVHRCAAFAVGFLALDEDIDELLLGAIHVLGQVRAQL